MASRTRGAGGLTGNSKRPPNKKKGVGFVSRTDSSVAFAVQHSMNRRALLNSKPPPHPVFHATPAEEAAISGIQPSHVSDSLPPSVGDDNDWYDVPPGEAGGHEQHYTVQVADLVAHMRPRRKRVQTQNREQLYARRAQQWEECMPDLVGAYLEVKRRRRAHEGLDIVCATPAHAVFSIFVVDLLDPPHLHEFVRKSPDERAVVTLMRYGLVACTPAEPALAIGLHTLELLHQLIRYHPRLSMQAFARALSAFSQVSYRPEFRRQLSETFDTYLLLLRHVERRVNVFLGRDSDSWRVLNLCPPCTYEVSDEPPLPAGRMWAMDGNSSLKRHANAGSADKRTFHSDYALAPAFVDKFKNEVRGHDRPEVANGLLTGAEPGDGGEQSIPCVSNWKNLQPEHMKTALDQFEQTGSFVSACRHGYILHCSEMIRSGELAKYGLAHTAKMLDVGPRPNQLVGYDIGCGFETTLQRSSLGNAARTQGLKMIVGAFHGHAHNRVCQIQWHPLTFTGAGLEDFETCERIFFESNEVARGVRYASHFHYQQAIDLHWRHWDASRYEELSRWLINKYVYACEVLEEASEALAAARKLGFGPQDYERWLQEEREYLASLREEPSEDVLAVGYVQALQAFYAAQTRYSATQAEFNNLSAADYEAGPSSIGAVTNRMANIERERRHAEEKYMATLSAVQGYENTMRIDPAQRWTAMTAQWRDTMQYLNERSYRLALSTLERLVVQRLLELIKANMSGICYKMRVQIAKALKNRSAAIRTALDKYNQAARQLDPTATPLLWEEVVNWTELQDFTLLRFARRDIRDKPWAVPTNRLLMNQYFKSLRAREELDRLNVEVRRLRTYIDDNDKQLSDAVRRAREAGNPLSVELEELQARQHRINATHRARLDDLAHDPRFTGRAGAGMRSNNPLSPSVGDPAAHTSPRVALKEEEEDSDIEELLDHAEALNEMLQRVERDVEGDPLLPSQFQWQLGP